MLTAFLRSKAIALLLLLALAMPAQAFPQLLIDMHTGEVLAEKDAGQPWHPASLTKLMTALLAFEAIEAGQVNLDTPVQISANALSVPPSKIGAPVGTAYRMEDALYMLIVKSANDIAVAIGETLAGSEPAFVANMNAAATRLGMTATHFVNPHGLHDERQVTSARDLAILGLTIRSRFPQYDQMFATGAVRLGQVNLRSHNDLLGHFAGVTGMKTGYVCSSGLNIMATVERDGRALMAIILGGSSGRERGELAAQMFTEALAGTLRGSGQPVWTLANAPGTPVDMRPYICGKEAGEYVAMRKAAFPLGLEGQPSFLTDSYETPIYRAASLGIVRNVPLPRPRPLRAPAPSVAEVAATPVVPLPRPRPAEITLRAGLN